MAVVRAPDLAGEERAALTRVVASLRDLMRAAAQGEVRAPEWNGVADDLEALRARLGPPTRSGAVRPRIDAPAEARTSGEALEVGAYHPFALPMRVTIASDGLSARAGLVGDALLEGPLGAVHGGIIAWAFDVVLGCLVQARVEGGLTRSLEVRYHRPTPLGVPLLLESRVVDAAGRRTTVAGELRHGEQVTASATGAFVVARR